MPLSLTPQQITTLRQHASAAARNAYAPYSSFRVGAALLTTGGDIATGCNVENASFRLTTCAEQSAIAAAVNLYGPTLRIRAIAVANLNATACPPCGACRQTILEFSTPDTLILYPASDNSFAQTTIADLLPAAFLLKIEATEH